MQILIVIKLLHSLNNAGKTQVLGKLISIFSLCQKRYVYLSSFVSEKQGLPTPSVTGAPPVPHTPKEAWPDGGPLGHWTSTENV